MAPNFQRVYALPNVTLPPPSTRMANAWRTIILLSFKPTGESRVEEGLKHDRQAA